MSKNVLARGKKQKALALLKAGQLSEAMDLLAQVCVHTPADPEAWMARGVVCGRLNRHADAAECFHKVIRLQPGNAEAHFNLGIAERSLGFPDKAEAAFRQAIKLNPNYPEPLESLAHGLINRGEVEEAAEVLRAAVRLRPDNAEWISNLGSLLQAKGLLTEAEECYRRAQSLKAGAGFVAENLGSVLAAQGRMDEALSVYREGLRRDPRNTRIRSNLLLTLNYLADRDPAEVLREHRAWDQAQAASALSTVTHANDRNPDRRLRIGYVSPDFRTHSVTYFLEPLLASHDHGMFDVYCYSDVPRADATTARLRSYADVWREIAGRSDADVAAQVTADGIDILVDLAGHTAANRLPVFARRPAPVQVSWLGYPNTTGLSGMGYRITDAFADPPGRDAFYSEKLIRLDGCFLCYQPPGDAPPVAPLPAETNGFITFGSFNNLSKMQPGVVALWSQVLHAVPGARLLVKNPSLTDPPTRQRIAAMFAQHGIWADRLELRGHTPTPQEHLAFYGRVDIAIDTFPYNGTTTTCEALWMGVPVVTLAGAVHAGRVGLSLLTAAGLPELIAATPTEYVARAAALAGDRVALSRLHAGLRERVRQSKLCDAAGFTRAMESALRLIWRGWCGAGAGSCSAGKH
jgi:protein O-GlcNAc transferase